MSNIIHNTQKSEILCNSINRVPIYYKDGNVKNQLKIVTQSLGGAQ